MLIPECTIWKVVPTQQKHTVARNMVIQAEPTISINIFKLFSRQPELVNLIVLKPVVYIYIMSS